MIITCPNCSTRYSLPQDKVKPGGQKVRCAKCGTVWFQEPEEPEPLNLTADQAVPAPPSPAWAAPAPAEPEPVPPPPPLEPPPSEPPAAPIPAAAEAPPRLPDPGDFASFHVPSQTEGEAPGAGRKIAIAVIVLVTLALAALVVFKQQVQDLTGLQLMSSKAPEAAAPPPATVPAPAIPAPPAEPPAPPPLTLTFDEVESSIEEIDGVRRLQVKGLIVNPADHEQVVPGLAFNMMDENGNAIDRWTFAAPVRALAPHTTTRFASQRDMPPTALKELVPGFDVPENPPPATAPADPAVKPAPPTPGDKAPTTKP